MNVIEARDLSKTFRVKQKEKGLAGSAKALFHPRTEEITAVDRISFSVEEGEILAFIGPNGAGKSTTIKMLTGILYPDGGSAQVLGIDPAKKRRQLAYEIGTVFGQKEQPVITTAFAVLTGSLSFWFVRSDVLGSNLVNSMINFSTYPDGIFRGWAKFLLYQIIPVGMAVYRPVHIMISFDWGMLLTVLGYAALLAAAAVFVFYRGLKRYSSSNLMGART